MNDPSEPNAQPNDQPTGNGQRDERDERDERKTSAQPESPAEPASMEQADRANGEGDPDAAP